MSDEEASASPEESVGDASEAPEEEAAPPRLGLAFTDLTIESMEALADAPDVKTKLRILCELTDVNHYHVKECAKGRFRAFTYDRIGVCTMCAQFFRVGQQEVYRPSVEARNAEKRRRAQKLSNELDKRFWDPVKQLDADRKDQLLGTAAAEVDVPGVRVPAAPLAVDKD